MDWQAKLTEERNQRFLALLKPVHGDCQRWAFHLTQNATDAEDLFAQSILIGLENIHQLKNEAAFKTWMFRIIANAFRQMLRKRKRQPDPVEDETFDRLQARDDDWTDRTIRKRVIRSLVEQLAPDQRRALILFEMHGLSIKEVSAVMGKKDPAVRVLLHRSRQRLAELVQREGLSDLFPTEEPG
jgi:RNA polymerase sigma-70 factor (ECF subfamily)